MFKKPFFKILKIGLKRDWKELKKKIEKRLLVRLKQGMIKEVENLHQSGVSWKRLEDFGLEYKYIALYLQKKIGKEEMIKNLKKEIEHYAKRQLTWFKRDKDIHWVEKYQEAEKICKRFLS